MPYKFEVYWTQYHSENILSGLYIEDSLRVVDEASAKTQIAILIRIKGASNIRIKLLETYES